MARRWWRRRRSAPAVEPARGEPSLLVALRQGPSAQRAEKLAASPLFVRRRSCEEVRGGLLALVRVGLLALANQPCEVVSGLLDVGERRAREELGGGRVEAARLDSFGTELVEFGSLTLPLPAPARPRRQARRAAAGAGRCEEGALARHRP